MICESDPMRTQSQEMTLLMQLLEAELRQQALWSGLPPSPQAMSSVMPFMYDTLKLHEWLQWVFIPRTRALIEAGRTLPGNCHIHTLAEHELVKLDINPARLLDIIQRIDTTMNQSGEPFSP
jgi:uncharacterized protein YqcC (DUF446 family)